MRKIKKLVATLLAATMVLAMGVTAFAAGTTYNVSTTLYKNESCTSVSMGNSGIASVTATVDEENGTVDILLKTKSVFYSNKTGQLSKVVLLDALGETYEGYTVADDYLTFHIDGFPAEDFTTGSVITGKFTSSVPLMGGEKTGYLKINSMTAQ